MSTAIATNAPTRYEIAMIHPDGRRYLIGYTQAASGNLRALLDLCQQNNAKIGHAVCAMAPGDDSFQQVNPKRRADGYRIGDWVIRWTGRTQREAIRSPLPLVVDAQ
jgi:hypothetical protein